MNFIDRYSGSLRILLTISIVLIHLTFYLFSPNNLIMASMIESSFDVVVASMISISLYFSSKPADEDHPYGHWKYENLGTVIVGIIFIFPAYDLIKNNLSMLINHIENPIIPMYDLIMVFLILIPTMMIILLERRETIENNTDMTKMNFIHNLGDFLKISSVGLTILIMKIVYIWWLPSVVAICIMLGVVFSLIPQIMKNIDALTDHEAPPEVEKTVKIITSGYNISNLKTRVSGPITIIDFDVTFDGNVTISDANNITSMLESNIKNNIKKSIVTIRSK